MGGEYITDEFGDWLLKEVEKATVIETHGWAPERVKRVAERLQKGRPPKSQLQVVVYWARVMTAFTVPGRYIFFCRRLLERCTDDECAAFIVAHELAHHDLGHVSLFPTWMQDFAKIRGAWVVGVAAQAVEKRLYGPVRECAADRHGLDLCLAAGYDPEKCLNVFKILETYCLDMGRDDLVYGLYPDSDMELSPDAPPITKIRIWAWTRAKGYLPIQDREAECRRYLESL